MNIFKTLFSAIRAKAIALWNKIRMLLTPAFWQRKVKSVLLRSFGKLFDVRPKNSKDYYPVFKWLVSKRLAYAIVVTLCVICLAVLWNIGSGWISSSGTGVPTYKYNSLVLKFFTGRAQVTAHDGYIAYDGMIENGAAKGKGSLYNANGELVYQGEFEGSMYNGQGTQYYPGAGVQYEGTFVDNVYSGDGKEYRINGTVEYEGEYENGKRTGVGIIYNSNGNPVYSGSFQNGEIVFDELVGKSMSEVAQMYTGRQTLYSSQNESCIDMEEIGVICGLKDGSQSLEPEWTVCTVFVPQTYINIDGTKCSTISEVEAAMGMVEYEGASSVLLPEAITINSLDGDSALRFTPVEVQTDASFEDAVNVLYYDQTHPVYIHTFTRDGLIYIFYTSEEFGNQFDFYAICKDE